MQFVEITGGQRETFKRDGVTCLRELLEPRWIEELRLAIDEMESSFPTAVRASEWPLVRVDRLRGSGWPFFRSQRSLKT